MGQDCPSVLLYMMHSNNINNNNIYRFELRKPGERFSEGSEAGVLLIGHPVGIVYRSDLQTISLRVL